MSGYKQTDEVTYEIKAPTCPNCKSDNMSFEQGAFHRDRPPTRAFFPADNVMVVCLKCNECGYSYFLYLHTSS